ncbi:MAG: LysR family transcriptional regulator [Acidobacteria bacterium]|nr:LysR family transcriptional regulator [Acidobacteriota bacterium]
MPTPDLNQLFVLNAVLSENSVIRAAQRLHLSPSAMSRALARARKTVGDPILVKAGRTLVPTPRATEMRERVAELIQQAQAVLLPATAPDLRRIVRTFTLRTSDGFVETFGPDLVKGVMKHAPGIRLRFVARQARDAAGLRDGSVDLETGVVDGTTSPELRQIPLFVDRMVGVTRAGHRLRTQRVTAASYAAAAHVGISRQTVDQGWIDEALAARGLSRHVMTTVSGFAAAIAVARGSDLVATVPEQHTAALRAGMHAFALPFTLPSIPVSMLWHPRMHADPVHTWLRHFVRETVTKRARAA